MEKLKLKMEEINHIEITKNKIIINTSYVDPNEIVIDCNNITFKKAKEETYSPRFTLEDISNYNNPF